MVKHLQADPVVAEIRILDLKPYVNRLGHKARVPVLWLCGDLTDEYACAAAFDGVDLVIHCAGLVDRTHPADVGALHRNNVQGTLLRHVGLRPTQFALEFSRAGAIAGYISGVHDCPV